jgi:hypothetical protein
VDRIPPPLVALLGLSILLTPHPSPAEIWATPANVQWIMATALPLIATTMMSTSIPARANQVAFVTVAGLTGPFSLIAAPLWLWRIGFLRDRFGTLVAGLGLTTGAVQAYFIARSPPVTALAPAWLNVTEIVLLRWLSDPFLVRSALIAAAVIGFLLAASLLGRYRVQRAACVVYALAIMAVTVWKIRAYDPLLVNTGYGARYFYVPTCMIMFCTISLLFEKPLHAKIAGAAVSGLLVYSSIQMGFVRPPRPDMRQEWLAKTPLFGKQAVVVPIPPNWVINVPGPP